MGYWKTIIHISYVLSHNGTDDGRLLNVRETTPDDLFPTFLLPAAELVVILVKAALGFAHAAKCRRRGKRDRGIPTVLPSFFLSNVRLLCNK